MKNFKRRIMWWWRRRQGICMGCGNFLNPHLQRSLGLTGDCLECVLGTKL